MAISTAIWCGIVLGGLIVLTFAAGMTKLAMNNRTLKRKTKEASVKAARKLVDEEKAVRGRGEGDLFGVRAIESGYFGGVAQSRSHSPAPSYKLAPGQTPTNWGKSSHSTNTSVSSFTPGERPSPLRLQPPDHISLRKQSLASIGGMGGEYMPPLPSPRENRAVMPFLDSERPAEWVSPLDVHFSRPTTPQASARPTSFLPKLNFPELPQNSLLASPPRTRTRSKAAPEISSEVPVPLLVDPTKLQSTDSYFPQARVARQSTRSFFHTSASSNERPRTRRSPKDSYFPEFPLNTLPPTPAKTSYEPNLNFPFDNRNWNSVSSTDTINTADIPFNPPPIIRDSIVSKHRASIFQPPLDSPEIPSYQTRAQSVAASSIYSSRESSIEPAATKTLPFQTSPPQPPPTRNRLSRSHDSIRLKSRKQSPESMKRTPKERNSPNPAGSDQTKKLNFDHPRESPFSNSELNHHV